MNKYKKRTITCLHCGKVDTKRRPEWQKYCSLDCYRSAKRPNRKTGKIKECTQCGKEIYVPKSQENPFNYCSRKCFSDSTNKKDKYVCKICNKIFYWSPSRIKQSNPQYCSIDCRNKCLEWKRNAVIAGNLIQQNNKKPTSLEIAGEKILDELNIEYKTQFLICNKFIVDVFIPEKKLVIQWDGDYWHGFGGAKDERQKKRQRLDKSQDAYMKKAGFIVIRFWEHEVKKEAKKVNEFIKKAIQ